MINSYPHIYNLGHAAVRDIFTEPFLIEEKVDGSQFSFGIFDQELQCRSKGSKVLLDAPEGMFTLAVESVKYLAPKLRDGWTYRCEYLSKPKHNTLTYSRIPLHGLIVFDITTGLESYLSAADRLVEAKRIGLEVVPVIETAVTTEGELKSLLDRTSCLGGSKIEGIVIKSNTLFGPDKKRLMAKFVSEEFKEVHRKVWKEGNPAGKDIVERLIAKYKSDARWRKAVQHLREQGILTDSPKDIGGLMIEAKADILKECEEEIKELLFIWARDKILRGAVSGLAEWYKEELLKKQFADGEQT